ncbi:BTB And Kelch [Cooperia oncophora]
MAENRKEEIEILNVESGALMALIDFCYSGRIRISDNNVHSILPAACLLQLSEVQSSCCKFLKDIMDWKNCLEIRAIADTYTCRRLLRSAKSYILHNFQYVVGNEHLLAEHGAGMKANSVNTKVEMQDGVHILEYQSSAHYLFFFTLLAEHRDVLSDVTLVAEGTRIRAHRIVLSTCSDYFKAMFTNNMAENRKEEIEILNLSEVQSSCCKFLKDIMDWKNCLEIRAIADTYTCRRLLRSAKSYILHNFQYVVGNEHFYELPLNQLIEFISSDELSVRSEEQVFDAVLQWIKFDLPVRRKLLPKLLEHVRLPLCSPKFLAITLSENDLVTGDAACRTLLDEAKTYQLLKLSSPEPPDVQGPPLNRVSHPEFREIIVTLWEDTQGRSP